MRSAGTPRSGGTVVLAALISVFSLAAGSAWADKLIVFRTGKVMRAKSVTVENGWTMVDLGKGSTVGVRSEDVSSIEDASAETAGPASTPNMASTEGRGVTRDAGGGAGHTDDSSAEISSSIQERIEQRQQELQDRQNQEAEAAAPTAVGVPGLRPLQSIGQPAAGRGFRRSRNISSQAPGSQAATGSRQVQQREDAQDIEEDGDDE